MDKTVRTRHKAKRGPQARGLARRLKLEAAAETLLERGDIDQISLADVAKEAGIPVASAYSFYSNISDLFAALQITHTEWMFDEVERAIKPEAAQAWSEIIEQIIDGFTRCLRDSRVLQQLRLSHKVLPEVRYAEGRPRGVDFAERVHTMIDQGFELPEIEGGLKPFVVMLDIAEAVLVSEFIRSNELPKGTALEAKRATIAYLNLYIPAILPRRRTSEDTGAQDVVPK
ncbi:TetR/AcrR family transcriptional regulator [Ruegeria sp. Ofav3-42]|uniref:TetR/AcrR family transcriptional regulator n=1 Tax=Ruegeria sp. Ofav3-42 TaxID=2917759 RepID=UPI001EF49C3B|nr:TetR/AcrR family transcriptional regulator [Ruegeria sp. Ofav3-42]MCG7521950.1 TetR/AcrR family transcriptional regulator [Ruegeria sp. Ofav3-42]